MGGVQLGTTGHTQRHGHARSGTQSSFEKGAFSLLEVLSTGERRNAPALDSFGGSPPQQTLERTAPRKVSGSLSTLSARTNSSVQPAAKRHSEGKHCEGLPR